MILVGEGEAGAITLAQRRIVADFGRVLGQHGERVVNLTLAELPDPERYVTLRPLVENRSAEVTPLPPQPASTITASASRTGSHQPEDRMD